MLDLQGRSILALGAHPDDLELGCLGLLISAQAAGSRVTCVVMSSCDFTRRMELQRALRGSLGKDITIRAYRFEDGSLHCNPKTVGHVEDNLEGVDLVLTMTKWDTHQDHRALERIALSACRRRPLTLLGYHSMSSTNEFKTDFYIELSPDILQKKVEAIAQHTSQAEKPYMQPEFIRSWHQDRTAQLMGIGPVELFHVYRMCHLAPMCEGA